MRRIGGVHVNKYSLLLVLRPGLKPGEDEHQQSAMWTRKGWEESSRGGLFGLHYAGQEAAQFTCHFH